MFELALALLPVAAASGWYVASKYYKNTDNNSTLDESKYFKGLNYLVNERSDKAIDVFVNLLEVDSETIEIHLALGTLFRKRGEVEKAIRLHQNLIARPELKRLTRFEILNELGMDYMHAGLLDRAEALFLELEKHHEHRLNVTKQLLSVYLQEKEWERAITYATKLSSIDSQSQSVLLAHLHCEMALHFSHSHQTKEAKSYLKKALKFDANCIRSNLINAQLAMEGAKYKVALDFLFSIKQQDIQFVPVFLELFLSCFDKLNKQNEKLQFLATIDAEVTSSMVTKAFVLTLDSQKGSEEAYTFLKTKVRNSPNLGNISVFSELLNIKSDDVDMEILSNSLRSIYHEQHHFHCKQCGFDSEKLNWMCPSCKSCGVVRPIFH
ncbi:MAG: lipopolysaccharide assembly protein LapB [Piscirickettsiaceae bacterium]|nr:MAG: lipopolysaccharide assembly protein LapB [Piscirickettsiaceae bacterium]PCI67796.1 MAG: lipopolysaccharide assembly protein LapB [Piscirickettsiaceae bacterium]